MTIAYPDLSNHNGAMPLQAGTVACFAKSSEGTGYRDAYYGHYKSESARVGALFGAFHFLREGNGAGQARFAFSIVGRGVPMMIDFEPEYDADGNPISLPSLADAIAFRDTYRSLGGLVRLNYLPRWYWAGHLGSPSLAPLADLALVSSDYTTYSDTGPGWTPYGGVTPSVWQYTDKQPYSGQRVDFNAYRGTLEQFRALLAVDPIQGADMPLTNADVELILNYQLPRQGGRMSGTTSLGGMVGWNDQHVGDIEAASSSAAASVAARVDALAAQVAKLTAPPAAQVDLAALEALIEQHLAAGAVPGVIAAAVLEHLSAATANAKP